MLGGEMSTKRNSPRATSSLGLRMTPAPLRLVALCALMTLPLIAAAQGTAGAAPLLGTPTPASAALADLSIGMTANPSAVSPGQDVDFKSTVVNNGPDAAANAFYAEHVPTVGSFVSVTTSQGSCNFDYPALACEFGTIASGGSAVVDLVWTTPGEPAPVTNDANVGATTEDPNFENNEASATAEPCGTDCTGGWLDDGGRVDGPPLGGDVTQSADILAPPGVHGPVSSVNTPESPCEEPPDFDPYGQVFVLEVPSLSGKKAFTFRLKLVTSSDPTIGIPPNEPLNEIELLRGCVPLPHCRTHRHNLASIPEGSDGCLFKVHRNMRTKNVVITELDTGQDPPIRGGG